MSQISFDNYLASPYLAVGRGYLDGSFGEVTGMQVDLRVDTKNESGMQTLVFVDSPDDDYLLGMQVEYKIISQPPTGIQVDFFTEIKDGEGQQVEFQIKPTVPTGMQAKIFPLAHWLHPKYLTDSEGYLTEAYLTAKMCAFQGMQTNLFIDSPADDYSQGMQTEMKVDTDKPIGLQVELRVDGETPVGFQTNMVKTTRIGQQANFVIYNTTQLRILCDFASRGTVGEYNGVPSADNANWKTNQAMETGDLGKLSNINTDVLEQRVQTDDGVVGLWELQCDTGVGNTFVDTIAILEHNLTKSAIVTFQASDSPTFSAVKYSFNLDVELENIYYIAPTLPTLAARYFRIFIQDPSNSDNHLKLGTILFGSSQIFTPRETFQNPVEFGLQHFKDTIDTEGYTNVSNDRAMRKLLSLNFLQLNFDGGNYRLLQDYQKEAKTDLKCLIIPRPTRPSSLAVFSKLTQLPSEQHNAIDDDNHHVDLTLDWDESL